MLSLAGAVGRWRFEIWQASAGRTRVAEDDFLVAELPGFLRIAVIDGVSSTRDSPRAGLGLKGGVWAASVVRAALRSNRSVQKCLEEANAELFAAHTARSDRAAATVAVADIRPAGVEFFRAGDCDVWVRGAAGWRPSLVGRPFSPDRSGKRLSGAVGHWPELQLERSKARSPKAFVLASDGARLNDSRIQDIEEWLGGLREWEAGVRSRARKVHDDLTVLRVERQ